MYEVELKFPLLESRTPFSALDELAARRAPTIEQRDLYFAHPARDFEQTDEALRVRVTEDENAITYKGPRLDDRTKTRREIEIAFESGRSADLERLLQALGFREVRAVRKRRTPYHLEWEGRAVEAVHDVVEGLGEFLEIETSAGEDERTSAQESILRLGHRLGLANPEHRSYLALLLDGEPSET